MNQLATDEILGRSIADQTEWFNFFTIFQRVFAEIDLGKYNQYRLFFCFVGEETRIKTRYDIILAERRNRNKAFRSFDQNETVFCSCKIKLF